MTIYQKIPSMKEGFIEVKKHIIPIVTLNIDVPLFGSDNTFGEVIRMGGIHSALTTNTVDDTNLFKILPTIKQGKKGVKKPTISTATLTFDVPLFRPDNTPGWDSKMEGIRVESTG